MSGHRERSHADYTRTVEPGVRLLGTPQIWTSGGWRYLPLDKRLALLTYLAVSEGWVTRERLSYLFWADVPTAQSRVNLRRLLLRTRALPLPVQIESGDVRLRWSAPSDVKAFRLAVAAGDWVSAARLYAGDLVEGLEIDEAAEIGQWLQYERAQLREAYRGAALSLAESAAEEGRATEAEQILGKLQERDPLDETVVQRRLRLLVDAGATAEARRVFERFAALMADRLGLPPSAGTEAIVAEAERLLPAQRPKFRPVSRVREPLTSFVGREAELVTIRTRLTAEPCRLLTLVGPGGAGKTRLAMRAAGSLADSFEDGVALVPLASVADASALPLALAAAVGVDLKGGHPPLEQVSAALKDRRLLLVLDQFEHMGEAALALSTLLNACPNVRCLVTSRERLRLQGEWLLPVVGLGVPVAAEVEPDEATEFAAVQLLLDRARQVRPDFALTQRMTPVAVRLCRWLEGHPLGIELVAGTLRGLTLEEAERALLSAPSMIATDSLDVSERHRSLRATFDHSWQLLTDKERAVLAGLSVFAADFDASGAAAVTGADRPVLASLVEKSLLRTSEDSRYDAHPLVRELARENLAEDPEAHETAIGRHASHYLRLAAGWNGRVHGPDQAKMIDLLAVEYPNVTLAWLEALSRGWLAECRDALDPILFFHGIQGRFHQGIELFQKGIVRLEQSGHADDEDVSFLRARLVADTAWFHSGMADFEAALELARQALVIGQALDSPAIVLRARQVTGSVAARRGHYATARTELAAGMEQAERAADSWAIALIAGQLGLLELRVGDPAAARGYFERALEVNEALSNKAGVVNDLDYLGRLALEQGDVQTAAERFERALALAEEARFHLRVAYLRLQSAVVSLRRGETDAAEDLARSALAAADEHGQRAIRVEALVLLGRLEAAGGDTRRAAAEGLLLDALRAAHDLGEVPLMLAAILELTLLRGGPEAPTRLSLVAWHPAASPDVRARARSAHGEVTAAPSELQETVTSLLAPR